MGTGGGGSPQQSAEYTQYAYDFGVQNRTATPITVHSQAELNRLRLSGAVGWNETGDFGNNESTDRTGGEVFNGFPVITPLLKPGELTGTTLLSEQAYYEDKYVKQQEAFQAKVDLQQKEQADAFAKSLEEQQTILAGEREANSSALKARQEEIDLASKTKMRDDMFAERTMASESAVDYVNQQVSRERSNAALFGIDYNITDEQKAGRTSDYFSSIWNQDNETKLTGLFSEIGSPEGFTNFNVGLSDTATSGEVTPPPPQSTVVGTTQGTRRRTVLTEEQPLGGSNTLLGA